MNIESPSRHRSCPSRSRGGGLVIASLSVAIVAAWGISSDSSSSFAAADGERILFVRGADRSGGFLEAGSDAQRTEHLGDIANLSTNGGNHGWGEFATALRSAGYGVDQIEEGAEQAGPTEGQPVDFAALDLDAYDLVVFGSNNAVYDAGQIDAVDNYVRGGGAALFISDANFGGSWPDAPNSDQQFLDRYGIVVHQDTGTYQVDDDEFVAPQHPVLTDVSSFDGEGVSPFEVGDVDGDLELTVLAAAEQSVRTNTGNDQGPTRSATPDDAALWVAEVGDGRLAGHFDRNTFFNTNGAGTDIGRFDNERLALNLVDWLTAADSSPPPSTVPPTTDPTASGERINDRATVADEAVRCSLGRC